MITGDNPIKNPEDDVIGRAATAQKFAQQVLELDTSEGAVVGVLGPWGSGKTSFINLARREFEKAEVPILDFNPWMFSGTAQLVESFFIELTAQLKGHSTLAEVGEYLENYGEVLSGMGELPVIGAWIDGISDTAKVLSEILQRRKKGVQGQRKQLEEALSDLDKPIVVVLDDIDRLETSEIRDIFKLVRLTANFPNIIYIVAFDRDRVEDALAEQGLPGRDYLEKILQVPVDLPVVPSYVLTKQIISALNDALTDIENLSPVDEQVWPDVLMEVIQPLIRNLRDIRRYTATIHGTIRSLNGQIALADLLALEAIRIFLPDVFKLLHSVIDGLTGSNSTSQVPHPPEILQKQTDSLIEAAGDHGDVVKSMIMRLFPAGGHYIGGGSYGSGWKKGWLKERRVAHEDILRLYLERFETENLRAFMEAEQALKYIANRDAFDNYLRSLDPTKLQDVIASLEVFEEQFTSEHIVPGTIVLLNLLPLPERQRGMFDWPSRVAVTHVVYRLLKSINNSAKVEIAVHEILPELKSLSSKLALIDIVGHQKNIGHKLVSEQVASEFEKAWREEVRSASVDDLTKEHDLLQIFLRTKCASDPSENPINIDNSPKLTLSLLRAARSETLSQGGESRAVQRTPCLHWDTLIELYDDEATLKERIESLKIANLKDSDDIIELADKYLGGYRDVD